MTQSDWCHKKRSEDRENTKDEHDVRMKAEMEEGNASQEMLRAGVTQPKLRRDKKASPGASRGSRVLATIRCEESDHI